MQWPDRLPRATAPLDWSTSQSWSFSPINHEKFPAIDLARRCGEIGGAAPAIFNAANEVAVAAFMSGEIGFTSIMDVVEETVQKLAPGASLAPRDLADVIAIEENARTVATEVTKRWVS